MRRGDKMRAKQAVLEWPGCRSSVRGFTLIELMVVIAILGILATIVVPRMVGRVDKANRSKAMTEIKGFQTALEAFRLDCGRYPTSSEGLNALIRTPGGIDADKYQKGGYLQTPEIPKDPWGHDYIYVSPGLHNEDYDVESYGKDRRDGGKGDDADIESWAMTM